MNPIFAAARKAISAVASLTEAECSALLLDLSDALVLDTPALIAANTADLNRMDSSNPLYDRLALTESRISAIASDMRNVASLPSPAWRILEQRTLPNGLELKKMSVPFGVVGVIYEARPNVTFDVFSLCMRSGNVCILKGGRDASDTNEAAVRIIKKVLSAHGINENAVNLLPATHEAAGELLSARGFVDLVIPRGGRRLIDFVRENAKIPCIETGAGVVNTYFDSAGDLEMGKRIIHNAKTRRVSVCNALDCLIIHSSRLPDLPVLCDPLSSDSVILYADERAYASLSDSYPANLLRHSDPESFGTEYMDYKMAVRTVDSLEEALEHIDMFGSGHSECIITEDTSSATAFQLGADAACVYVNAPTSFTDGAQFGLGAEIGISTQKLGPRGPMGLDALNTYKWLVTGRGQTRP